MVGVSHRWREPEASHGQSRMRDRRRVGPAFARPRQAGGWWSRTGPHECRRANRVAEIEIGIFKSGRQAYGFDDIAIVPSRRTRDPEDVDISWEIDAYRFELPLMGSAMDGVVSPATAIELGRLGGVGVLNLEGVWTRYEDPEPLLEEIAHLDTDKATARMQQIYGEPMKPELITQRIREIKDAGVVSAASLTPQRTAQFAQALLDAELDLFVIQGTVVSAEHVSKT